MLSVLLYSTQNVEKLRQTLTSLSQFAKYPGDIEVLVITHTEDLETWEAVEALNLRTDTWVATSRQNFELFGNNIFQEAAQLCIGDYIIIIGDYTKPVKNWDRFLGDPIPDQGTPVLFADRSYYAHNRKRFIDGPE